MTTAPSERHGLDFTSIMSPLCFRPTACLTRLISLLVFIFGDLIANAKKIKIRKPTSGFGGKVE
jgi:hypothetical protein